MSLRPAALGLLMTVQLACCWDCTSTWTIVPCLGIVLLCCAPNSRQTGARQAPITTLNCCSLFRHLWSSKRHLTKPKPACFIAIDHPALSSNPQVLCAAACTCKAWQDAVQQCGVCSTDAVLKLDQQLHMLHSFARWLPKHAHLLRSITANDTRPDVKGPLGTQYDRAEAAAQLMQLALEAAAVRPATAAPAAAAATSVKPLADNSDTAHHQQQQQQQGLRLASFSTDCLLTPGLLDALPAHSLTRLVLMLKLDLGFDNVDDSTWIDGPAVAAALAQLSSLQELRIGSGPSSSSSMFLPGSCLDGVAQLCNLTVLEIIGDWQRDVEHSLLRLLAQPLPVRQLTINLDHEHSWVMDLAHLKQLQQLHCSIKLLKGTRLPEQLQEFALEGSLGRSLRIDTVSIVLALQQLQRLDFQVGFSDPQLLLQLAELPALEHLASMYDAPDDGIEHAVTTSSAWGQLPQLRQLSLYLVDIPGGSLSVEELQSTAIGAAAAAGLTKLVLAAFMAESLERRALHLHGAAGNAGDAVHAAPATVAAVCDSLARLTNLQELQVFGHSVASNDAMALTVLNCLTRLLFKSGDGVGGAVATALAQSMKQLRCVDLHVAGSEKGIKDVAKLMQFTEVCLGDQS